MPEESILDSVKSMVNVTEEDKSFDKELISFINTFFMELSQMGIGPPIQNCFSIRDNTTKWSDFEPTKKYFEPVKTYISLKARIIFDPPNNSNVSQAYENQITESRDRLRMAIELEEVQNG